MKRFRLLPYGLVMLILLSSTSLIKANEEGVWHSGADLGYSIILWGDLNDYFADDFNYAAHASYEAGINAVGAYRWEGRVQLSPLKSDDVRESSKLRMLSASIGPTQHLWERSWFSLGVFSHPELVFWWIYNDLSDNFDSFDRGYLLGLQLGIVPTFKIKQHEIGLLISSHTPELILTNTYFDVGLRYGYRF